MKTIYELWNELTNHPDYVTRSLWTIEDVASNFKREVEEYFEINTKGEILMYVEY